MSERRTDMANPDREERSIQEAYAAFAREIEVPDVSAGVRAAINERERRRPMRTAAIIAAVAAMLVISACAAMGSFDWLLEAVKPRYEEVIERVESGVVVDGVKLEVIAAKRYDKLAVIYVSLTDTRLEGRVTADTPPDAIKINGQIFSSNERRLIYYEPETQTAAYEFLLTDYDEAFEEAAVSLGNLAVSDTVSLPDLALEFDPGSVSEPETEVVNERGFARLPIGRIEDIPDMDGWWIAGAGVGENTFTVLLRHPASGVSPYVMPRDGGREGESSYNPYINFFYNEGRGELVNLYLMTADGKRINGSSTHAKFIDENNEALSSFDEENIAAMCATVTFAIFPDELEGATLYCERDYVDCIRGPFEVTVPLEDGDDTVKLTTDVESGGTLLEDVAIELTPLGIIVGYDYTGGSLLDIDIDVYVETAGGELHPTGASAKNSQDGEGNAEYVSFRYFSNALDVGSITAVVVNGVRVEV